MQQHTPQTNPSSAFSSDLQKNLTLFQSELGNSSDFTIRQITVGSNQIPAAVLWIDGMVDQKTVNDNVLNPLLQQGHQLNLSGGANTFEILRDSIISAQEAVFEADFDATVSRLLSGYTILLIHGLVGGISIKTQGYEVRSILVK